MLSADLLHVIKWYVDESFAVHPNFKSYTGSVMTMGEGAIQGNLSKQKLNTCSSCDIELVGNDDASTKILWTQLFMEAQGYKVQQNIMYQDNKSTIQLLKMGVAVLASNPARSILVTFSWQTNTTKDSSTSSTVLQVRCGRVQ